METYPYQTKELYQPNSGELCTVLRNGLSEKFKHIEVMEVECPDLTQKPWSLAAPGICGKPKLLDCGGVPYLMPLPIKKKIYNFDKLARLVGDENAFFLGAGAAGFHVLGRNAEMMANLKVGDKENVQTHIAKVGEKGECVLESFNCKEFGLLGNFLASEGLPGKVIKITAKGRSGEENFTESIRSVLKSKYPDQMVGLGGVFQIKSGKANLHVMPDFSTKPLHALSDINEWLQFYEMSSPLVCLSVLYNIDPGYDLRIEHTHCFSEHGDGGHYHYDTTPEEVEYEAYYVVGETLYRVDQPNQSS